MANRNYIILEDKDGKEVLPVTDGNGVFVEGGTKKLENKLTEIDSKTTELNEQLEHKAKQSDLKTLESRMNNFTALPEGSTVGDAELIDGRVGQNGELYDNIGSAIRSQFDKIADISPNLYEFWANGLYCETGITNTSDSYWHSKPIRCNIGDVFKINKRVDWSSSWIGVLDKNMNLISGTEGALNSWIRRESEYDSITISEYNYNNFVINKDNIGYIIISFSKFDSVTDKNKNIIVRNMEYPSSYIAKDVKLKENIKLSEAQEKQVEDNINNLIYEHNKPIKKPVVTLNFDAFNFDDGRFDILEEYGFKGTVTMGTPVTPIYNEEKANKYKRILNNGWDIAIYSATKWPKDIYGNEAFTSESKEIINAWEEYVKIALEDAELNGVYYPQTWFCRQNVHCPLFLNILKKYGFKMCRGDDFTDYNNTPMYFNNDFSFATRTKGLYPSTVEGCLWEIDQCINDTKGVSIFSHGIYATDEEAENNFGCTEANLRTVLDRIKKYVDEDKLEVVTYSKLYNMYNPIDSSEIKYNRVLKMLTN